jgi:transcription antitermination factor NusG
MRTAPIFTVGEKVRITSGPFRNVVGIIVRDAGKTSVALNVDILGQAALISIDPNDCEPVKSTTIAQTRPL